MNIVIVLKKTVNKLRSEGVLALASVISASVGWIATAAWSRLRGKASDEFDDLHGVETAREVPTWMLDVSDERIVDSGGYQASPPGTIEECLGLIDVDPSRYTFVDIGSGKGRILLAAAQFPFRRIMGVEFSSKLTQSARDNIALVSKTNSTYDRIELVCQSATSFTIPDGDLLVYMFNPFGGQTMRSFVSSLVASSRQNPRKIYLVYYNPVERSIVDELLPFDIVVDQSELLVYASR